MYDISTQLAAKIANVPDFPTKGVNFKDITPLLEDGKALNETIKAFVHMVKDWNFDKIICADSRGFLFGPLIAFYTGTGVVLARKPGKLPRPGLSVSYDLEYGSNTFFISAGAINPGEKVLIVDDLLATGGSARAMRELVEQSGGEVVGAAFLIELLFLDGANQVGTECRALVHYGLFEGLEVECNISSLIEDDQCRYAATYTSKIKSITSDHILIETETDLNNKELWVPKNLINCIFYNGTRLPYLE